MTIKGGFESFEKKFPFLCLSMEDLVQSKKDSEISLKPEDKKILSKSEEKLLYSFSRFPTEILEGKLFIVNIYMFLIL
jgi:hypothetical protein